MFFLLIESTKISQKILRCATIKNKKFFNFNKWKIFYTGNVKLNALF